MARVKKDGDSRTFRLRKDLCDKIDSYSKLTLLSKTAIVEKALTLYFDCAEEYEKSALDVLRNK